MLIEEYSFNVVSFFRPIHRAVLNNDIDMLRRQCVVLKSRQESVDIPANENVVSTIF